MYVQVINGSVTKHFNSVLNQKGLTGNTHANISALSRAERIAEGFYELHEINQPDDPDHQFSTGSHDTINDDFGVVYRETIYEYIPLDTIRVEARERINQAREFHLDEGFEFNGKVFDTTMRSTLNLVGALVAINLGAPVPDNFAWRAKDNTDMPMDVEMFTKFAFGQFDYMNGLYRKSWDVKTEMDEVDDPRLIENLVAAFSKRPE